LYISYVIYIVQLVYRPIKSRLIGVVSNTADADLVLRKGKTMKRGSSSVCSIILSIILFAAFFLLYGCRIDQPGETAAEGHIRHKRVVRISQQEMMADIDRVLQLDEPSKLTEKRIP
jgi:hypothetical protein